MIIKCKMCGGDLNYTEGSTVCECEFCGTMQTIVNPDNEKKTNLFNRANRLRMNSEFDKAAAVYEQLVAEFPEEAEAYWGLCLCAYGIEYVDDPATGKKLPTCHRTLTASIMEDSNFEQACDCADSIARKLYREEAKSIDRIQKDILSIAASEAPYDVFICYKETAEDGGRTEDSVLAQDIYDALTAKGMKVFFSRITLEDKLGVQYEPYIFAALSSAKVMLAIGTAFEYHDAVWVKNEWSRFLSMMKTDKTKTLIPCFKGLDAYDMPKEFKGLQAQDMGKLGWLQDLVRGVEKLCGKGEVTASEQPVVQSNSNAENLMQRVYLFLEDGDWEQVSEYINKVLDADAKYAPAYVARLLVAHKLTSEEELVKLRKSVDDDPDWQKALRFADTQQKQTYARYAKSINDNENYDKEQADSKEKIDKYNAGVAAMNNHAWGMAVTIFHRLENFKDSKTHLQKCVDEYRQQLVAKAVAEGKLDPVLAAAKEKVEQAQCTLCKAQATISDAVKEKKETEKREQAIPEEIRRLTNDLSQVRGLFSGSKKREFEGNIDALKRELTSITQKKQEYEQTISKTKAEVIAAESALIEAKTIQERIDAELQKKELARWTDEAIIAAVVAAQEPFTQVGNIVTYGHYEQDNSGNGKEAIEWIVIKYDGVSSKSLLLSRYGLDAHRFDASVYQGWDKSEIRGWLNSVFLNTAFTSLQQQGIATTKVKTQNNDKWLKIAKKEGWGTSSLDGGLDTKDKLFILSLEEAMEYGEQSTIESFYNCESGNIVTRPTEYALKQGVTRFFGTNCDWWLRSPGSDCSDVSCVDEQGRLCSNTVDSTGVSIRPAFWLNLDSADIH